MPALQVAELTQATLAGTGAFDVLMRSVKTHLDDQFTAGRIKGPEYATVYLGSLELAMQSGLTFLLNQRKNDLEAQLLEKQIELATIEVTKANAQVAQIQAQTDLIEQQLLNAVTENTVLVAQECKLRAEFDHITAQTLKVNGEIALLTQKTATERAQTQALGVDADSVVGKQKGLYQAQTDGFARDAEQKAAKALIDTWSVRRTTDEATVADGVNMLNDTAVGRAVSKLLQGVGA